MEASVRDQIIATLKYASFHWAASYFKRRTSPEVEENREKAGGFIQGICHPVENYGQIKGAGIEWNRADIAFPFEADGASGRITLQSGIPVMFGVLTTENIEQAIARAGSKEGNKGYDAAARAIEMVNLIREIQAQ